MEQRIIERESFGKMADLFSLFQPKRSARHILDFVKTCRVPAGKYKGERIDLRRTPYMVRPLSLADSSNPCQLIILMWPSQTGKSLFAQLVSTYYTIECPSDILYVGATKAMIKKMVERRYTPLCESLGVIFQSSLEKKGKKTGDLTLTKEFLGGCFDAGTGNSIADLSSESKRLFIADEASLYKSILTFLEGYARLRVWTTQKKCVVPSTPRFSGTCIVENLFNKGIPEFWHVPCPYCDQMNYLDIYEGTDFGLKFSVRSGIVVGKSVVYVCKFCGKSFNQEKNKEIQNEGQWIVGKKEETIADSNADLLEDDDEESQLETDIDTVTTSSFNLHALNSQMETWQEIATAYFEALSDPERMVYYTNHVAGKPVKEESLKSIDLDSILSDNKGNYLTGTVPNGVLFLTVGCDLQKGVNRWKDKTDEEIRELVKSAKSLKELRKLHLPRIEAEVLGIGPYARSWSIDYLVFYGHTDNAYAGAFVEFDEWVRRIIAKNGSFSYPHINGKSFIPVKVVMMDSGYNTSSVYQFCESRPLCVPLKGSSEVKKHDPQKYKISKVDKSSNLVVVNTSIYKRYIYSTLAIRNKEGLEIPPPGCQMFPADYDPYHFDGLTSETMINDVFVKRSKGAHNEELDNRAYCLCGSDMWLDNLIKKAEKAKKRSYTKRMIVEELSVKMGYKQFLSVST